MKYRIFGTLLIFAILGGLYVVTSEPGNQQSVPTNNVPVDSESNALKGLKIN
jgi:hypothetical protein